MADVPRTEGDESPLERVRQRLYANARQGGVTAPEHTEVTRASAEGWKPDEPAKRGLSATAWFFIIALGFFVVAGIAAALILFLGGRSVNDASIVLYELSKSTKRPIRST